MTGFSRHNGVDTHMSSFAQNLWKIQPDKILAWDGAGQEISALAEKLLAFDSYYETESQFFLSYMMFGRLNPYWDRSPSQDWLVNTR